MALASAPFVLASAAASEGELGRSLPGSWRPFADNSPWNEPIPPGVDAHRNSDAIVAELSALARSPQLARQDAVPIRVVSPTQAAKDPEEIDESWIRPGRAAGCEVDLSSRTIRELIPREERETGRPETGQRGTPHVEVLTWRLDDDGRRADPSRTARASGFPLIAGVLRPEEVLSGEVRHALAFTLGQPDVDGDGVPDWGLRLQLDPSLGSAEFDTWKLNEPTRVLARALQKYGMVLVDRGKDLVLEIQLLDVRPSKHRHAWEANAQGLFKGVEAIPTSAFRVVEVIASR